MKQLMYMLNSATPNTKNKPFRCGQKNVETYTSYKIAVALDLGGQGTVYS